MTAEREKPTKPADVAKGRAPDFDTAAMAAAQAAVEAARAGKGADGSSVEDAPAKSPTPAPASPALTKIKEA
ncbi:MAG: hypothetical protein DCF29_08145 [Alphaproteobacteria bacterium]|nr:MAG: hypothetical protein DCF29_08145 [Alphaproteobacteria bacterium]